MTKRIIYPTQDGGVAIVIPSDNLPIEEVARKDVPAGVPFKIIDTVDVPSDRTFRAAWEAEMSSPNGTGLGQQAWFIEQYEAEIAAINAETAPAEPEEIMAAPFAELAPFQPVVAATIEQVTFPDEMPDAERVAAYQLYTEQVAAANIQGQVAYDQAVIDHAAGYEAHLVSVAEQNATNAAQHVEAVAAWEASKAARIEQLNAQIATQQAEMAA